MTHLTIEVNVEDEDDLGVLGRRFAEAVAEQVGTTRVKVYAEGQLVADQSGAAHEDECCECGDPTHDCQDCPTFGGPG